MIKKYTHHIIKDINTNTQKVNINVIHPPPIKNDHLYMFLKVVIIAGNPIPMIIDIATLKIIEYIMPSGIIGVGLFGKKVDNKPPASSLEISM